MTLKNTPYYDDDHSMAFFYLIKIHLFQKNSDIHYFHFEKGNDI